MVSDLQHSVSQMCVIMPLLCTYKSTNELISLSQLSQSTVKMEKLGSMKISRYT